jgi:hypothetical protein
VSVPAQGGIDDLERGLELELEAASPRLPRTTVRRPLAILVTIVVVVLIWEGI